MLLTAVSSVGVPKNTASAVRNFSPAAAAALENMGPRSASAEPKEDPKLKFSPSQLKEMERYGVSADLQTKIDVSLTEAVKFLENAYDKEKQGWPSLYNKDLSVGGQHALATLALIVGGTHPSDEIIQGALTSKEFKRLNSKQQTYSHAVAGLAHAYYIRAMQREYPEGKKAPTKLFSIEDSKKALKKIAEYLEDNIHESGGWRYPGGVIDDSYKTDLSNTQYALHLLYEAKELGIRVSRRTFKKILSYVLTCQEKNGPTTTLIRESADPRYSPTKQKIKARGWGYTQNSKASGSMTAAGLMCQGILKTVYVNDSRLRKEKKSIKLIDDSIMEGLAWLTKEFRADTNPVMGDTWKFYYLYGLEKSSDFLDIQSYTQTLDDGTTWTRHWYKEGAENLINWQSNTGAWPGSNDLSSELVSTSFAILFMKRATTGPEKEVLPKTPVTTGDGGKKTAKGSPSK